MAKKSKKSVSKKKTKKKAKYVIPKRIRYTTFLKKFMGDPDKFYLSEETTWDLPKNVDMNYVWTVLSVDGKQFVVNGWHFVNRDGYLISKVPHNGQDYDVFGVYNGIEKC